MFIATDRNEKTYQFCNILKELRSVFIWEETHKPLNVLKISPLKETLNIKFQLCTFAPPPVFTGWYQLCYVFSAVFTDWYQLWYVFSAVFTGWYQLLYVFSASLPIEQNYERIQWKGCELSWSVLDFLQNLAQSIDNICIAWRKGNSWLCTELGTIIFETVKPLHH